MNIFQLSRDIHTYIHNIIVHIVTCMGYVSNK
jgi:hypothetical protein